MKAAALAVCGVALATASVASAQTTLPADAWTPPSQQWYLGAGVGQGVLHKSGSDLTGLDNAQLDDTDTSYTLRGGWRFSPYGAVELGYYDFGRYRFSSDQGVDGSGRANSVGVSLVGIIPLQQFDLYGRLGVAHSKLTVNANGPLDLTSNNQNERQTEAIYGLGARWWFAPQWGVFAEWEKNDRIRIDSYVAGVDFRF
jgi:OOP family OmpA-OmpF porin